MNRSDLTSDIPTFIQLAESSLKRVLRTKHRTLSTAATVSGTGTVTVSGTVENYELQISSPVASAGPIKPVSLGEVRRYQSQYDGDNGRPLYGAIVNTTLYLAPIPDDAYTVEIEGEPSFSALSDSNTTNYILDDYPDIYLYGSLMQAEPFLKNDSRLATWEKFYTRGLAELELALERNAWPSTPVMPVPVNLAPMSVIPGR